jgi:hypothetical protein
MHRGRAGGEVRCLSAVTGGVNIRIAALQKLVYQNPLVGLDPAVLQQF